MRPEENKMKLLALALAMFLLLAACGGIDNSTGETSPQAEPKSSVRIESKPAETEAESMVAETAGNDSDDKVSDVRIRLTIGDTVLTATMLDNETSSDFISLLPLTLHMNDLFGREKFAHLPRAISNEGGSQNTYEIGDVVYWAPGPDLAIFYHHDGQAISSGIKVIGKIVSGVEVFDKYDGSVELTIERIN